MGFQGPVEYCSLFSQVASSCSSSIFRNPSRTPPVAYRASRVHKRANSSKAHCIHGDQRSLSKTPPPIAHASLTRKALGLAQLFTLKLLRLLHPGTARHRHTSPSPEVTRLPVTHPTREFHPVLVCREVDVRLHVASMVHHYTVPDPERTRSPGRKKSSMFEAPSRVCMTPSSAHGTQ